MGNELIALGGAFLAAGVLARLGRRVGLPTIPFFMAAGIIMGPNTPGLVLVEHPEDLAVFAAVGLVLLLFHLGIEFSVAELTGGGRRLLRAGLVYLALNVGGGVAFGFALGWGSREAFVIGGAMGISSTAIVTKLLVELRRLANPETRLILGIIVVEDVFLALYLALLQPILTGATSPAGALLAFLTAFGFLLLLAAVARFGARWVGRLVFSHDDELLTVLFVGVAITVAGVAEELGVSDAIGALMAGLILSETSLKHRIERLVLPLRDAFAAVFFFAFGLTIDPGDIGDVALAVTAAVATSLVLNVAAGLLAARSYGFDRQAAANVGFTVLGRGEFSLILATLAASAGLDGRIGPFIALYVLVLALAAPVLASNSSLLAALLPGRLFPVRDTGVSPPVADRRPGRASEPRPRAARVARVRPPGGARDQVWRRLLWPTALFLVAFGYGVGGHVSEGLSFSEAVRWTWAAITPADVPPAATAVPNPFFTMTVTAFGVVTVMFLAVAVARVVIDGTFLHSWRRRTMDERIDRLRNHFIICAYGRVGRAAARQLEQEGVPFVVIDTKAELETQTRNDDVPYLIDDPTSEAVLRKAGLTRARGLLCAVDSDATNVYIALTARSVKPDIYIVARASELGSIDRLERAGANRVISPYLASGRQMASLAVRPGVIDALEFSGHRLDEIEVEEGSPLIGKTLDDIRGSTVPLLLRRRNGETHTHPQPETPVEAGDVILLWGEPREVQRVESEL